MDTEKINDCWAYHIVDQLVCQKVNNFCIAPGSRSSPITLAIAQRKDISKVVHFDERGLAFYAIGAAKASKQAVAIVVTSGTAVGNLLPAVMEASQSNISLIIITADRPVELQDCGSNQTVDQTRLFQNFVKWQCEISPSGDVNIEYVRSVIAYAVFESMQTSKGPIHINCRFQEPLCSIFQSKQVSISTTNYLSLKSAFDEAEAKKIIEQLYSYQKGLILVGITDLKSIDAIVTISKLLKWPIYVEVLSRINPHKLSDTLLLQLPYLLEFSSNQFENVDCILQFGDRIISKKILNWLKHADLKSYFLITEHSKKSDELHRVTKRIITPLRPFIEQFNLLKKRRDNNWLDQVKSIDSALNAKIIEKIKLSKNLSEHYLYLLLSNATLKDYCIFFGNSSVVRDANALFFPKMTPTKIFANRGASGIDGNIATIVGIGSVTNMITIAVIGDLTFLHDLTSLSLFKFSKKPIILIVINNDGGEIFSQLPVINFKDHFEKFFKTPHGLSFSKIADFFSIEYKYISSILDLKTYIETCAFQSSQIVELKINAINNRILREEIIDELKGVICSHSKKMEIPRICL